MTAYLGYLSSTGFTKAEQLNLDKKIEDSQIEFSKGFVKGCSLSLAAYLLYFWSSSAAQAADGLAPQTPGNTGAVQPIYKPGFQPLSETGKGSWIGSASGICAAALESKDFYIGLSCAFLVIMGGTLLNRK